MRESMRVARACQRAVARRCILLCLLAAVLQLNTAGCATQTAAPPGRAPLASTTRDQIGRLAIRGPTAPSVTLTAEVDTKGAAAGKTAKEAGLGWLGGSLQAAGESGDPLGASLIAAFGIVTAPVVAAGGAIYGAVAADSDQAVAAGNAVLLRRLDFAPDQFRHALAAAFGEKVPAEYTFVPAFATDADLKGQGFDSVLDVAMDSIVSRASHSRLEVLFELSNTVALKTLDDDRLLERRRYDVVSADRNISGWARDDGGALLAELGERFAELSDDIAEEFFLAPAVRVAGLEPVTTRRFGTGEISGTVPLFVWSALDGAGAASRKDVEYEIEIYSGDEPAAVSARTHATRHVPSEPLRACQRYFWKVRAHYQEFGRSTASEWSPVYRFKTRCR